MREGTRDFPKAFPEEKIDVVRIVHGVAGSTLGRLDSRETLRVTWARETSAKIEIHINGHFVDDRGTFGDGSRIGQSVGYAMGDWEQLVEQYGVGPGDKVEVSVVGWIEDAPTFGLSHEDFGKRFYYSMPDKAGPFFLGVPPEGLDAVEREDLRTLRQRYHSKTKVASSLWTREECGGAIAAFIARADEDVRTETDGFDYYA